MPDLSSLGRPADRPLAWVHLGDLHLTEGGAENHRALLEIVDAVNSALAGRVDFCVLPGDIADTGAPEEYALLQEAAARLRLPIHAIPGDHDFHHRSLLAFYAATGQMALPQMAEIRGHCCLFLDMVSPGGGGPDFRLGAPQLEWLSRKLHAAHRRDQDSVVFMHAYPADLSDPAEAAGLRRLFARHHVVCVDMGHTHYNELANDGTTIYATTRSVGQAEEGAVGFSVASVDAGGVSWRFRELQRPWPLTLVTAPVDRRLQTFAGDLPVGHRRRLPIRALAWSDRPVIRCDCRAGDGDWQAMTDADGGGTLWSGSVALPPGPCTLAVRATDAGGATDEHRIELAGPDAAVPTRTADGSDADRIGAWPENGIFGTQLGPNRNGRTW